MIWNEANIIYLQRCIVYSVYTLSKIFRTLLSQWIKIIPQLSEKKVKDESLIEYYDIMVELLKCSTNPIPLKYILSKKYSNFKHLRLPLTKLDYDLRNKIDRILGLN